MLTSHFYIYAETNPSKGFDKEKWKEISRNIDYNEADEEPETQEIEFDKDSRENGTSFSWQLLLYVLFGVLLFILLYFILRKNLLLPKNNLKKNDFFNIETIEKDLHESDLDMFLKIALEKSDYRLGTRVYYLMVIKQLSVKKLIQYKQDKTNRQYINELRESQVFNEFSRITRIYEHIWYGNIPVNEKGFTEIQHIFKEFLQVLMEIKLKETDHK